MAISFYQGEEVDPHQAWALSGSNAEGVAKEGNDMKGLERLASHYGFSSEYAENLSVEKLEYLLSKHVLVVLNIKAHNTGSATHAILATGYDRIRGVIFVSDPANVLTEMTFNELNSRWSAHLSPPYGMSYRSGFILYPK